MIDEKKIKWALEIADKFNDSVFTNTEEMVEAISVLSGVSEQVLSVKGFPEKRL